MANNDGKSVPKWRVNEKDETGVGSGVVDVNVNETDGQPFHRYNCWSWSRCCRHALQLFLVSSGVPVKKINEVYDSKTYQLRKCLVSEIRGHTIPCRHKHSHLNWTLCPRTRPVAPK